MSQERPFIYIHMGTSLDGKIIGKFMETENSIGVLIDYVWTSKLFKPDAIMIGTKTVTEMNNEQPVLNSDEKDVPEGDFIAKSAKALFLVVPDSAGKIGWKNNYFETVYFQKSNIIEILSEKASPQYRNYLRSLNISYIIAGKEHVDVVPAAKALKQKFGINTLGVLGGATINWSFVQAGIVDELSICLVAAGDGANKSLTLFEKAPQIVENSPVEFELKSIDRLSTNGLWLKYTPKGARNEERPYSGQFELGKKNVDAKFFTGTSYLNQLSNQGATVLNVTFEPGSRNN
ncbi:RibD C-terminal domain containing protein [Trichomonas vaginalis G3]|uniref:RibD C-terminal domain containing protein n=1 Tax=Trichomonas vaginalis (strain ATCC PRA-98 / G3) TaxID=412133 RepID=A2FMV5_TRIV3|nr:cupin domain-containing protein family [Trichomonas vaginalis G3]EAX93772.1 RibD C-terminal domain containing protein [Trichomonas vaginalis G3]KAI5535879.1 cupin domain-containing protein family [Trichomonas vaginalis G3]|eukprot:XP_001306702.1 RibD C-terminal domain containing protein [Trichomonas vaginalis G3]